MELAVVELVSSVGSVADSVGDDEPSPDVNVGMGTVSPVVPTLPRLPTVGPHASDPSTGNNPKTNFS